MSHHRVAVLSDIHGNYHALTSGNHLLILDTAATLPGPSTTINVTPQDVIKLTGSTYTLEFTGLSHGIQPGIRLDAVSAIPTGLLLSFDSTIALGTTIADDEDLVSWNGSTFA